MAEVGEVNADLMFAAGSGVTRKSDPVEPPLPCFGAPGG
jgi:hypothetical protein